MIRLTRDITIVRDGKEYRFVAGDVINPDRWPGIEAYLQEAAGTSYSDRMIRRASKPSE